MNDIARSVNLMNGILRNFNLFNDIQLNVNLSNVVRQVSFLELLELSFC
jgi:hypothetical protein